MITKNIKTQEQFVKFMDENLAKIDNKYINKTRYKSVRGKNKIEKIIIHTSAADDIGTVRIGAGMTSRQVSYQFAVLKDQDKTYKLLSDKYIGWHAGDNDLISGPKNTWGKNKRGTYNMNPNSIGIEIVNRQNTDIVSDGQIKQTISIVLDYIIKYDLTVNDVFGHFEISSQKHDPYQNWTKNKITTGETNKTKLKPEMDEFRSELQRLLNIHNNVATIEIETPEEKKQGEFDDILGYELFNDINTDYKTKKLIEIALYRFVNKYKNKTLKIRYNEEKSRK